MYDKAINRKTGVHFHPKQTLDFLRSDMANSKITEDVKRSIVKQYLDVSSKTKIYFILIMTFLNVNTFERATVFSHFCSSSFWQSISQLFHVFLQKKYKYINIHTHTYIYVYIYPFNKCVCECINYAFKMSLRIGKCREFPGGPVVKTPHLHCWGLRVRSLVRELRSWKPCGASGKKNKGGRFRK